jgi:hypothetical protein
MSNIDHVMKAPAQAGHAANPIEKFGGGFNAASPPSKNDPADDEAEMPCSTATAFVAKAAPPAGRRPLFRR